MSSVVISGDTSGSVTLQAPAVAGTTVLTLPATSGTVVTTATSTGISGSAITTGTVGVSVGGTGANTLTANNVILGNGTSAVQFVAPGSTGNVLTSNGTTWTSAAAAGGQLQTELFTAPGTWTKPSSATRVRVTVFGAGGAGSQGFPGTGAGTAGGTGGVAYVSNIPVSSPVAVTIGAGGANSGGPGGTSSFGPFVSCTGGAGGSGFGGTQGASGVATVSAGTTILNSNIFNCAGANPFPACINGVVGGIQNPTASGGAARPYVSSFGRVAGAGGVGGTPGAGAGAGGIGGAVLVEFVG
jgi:hypothetical protein